LPYSAKPEAMRIGYFSNRKKERKRNFMYTILLIVLVLMLIGALPTWPYSSSWGYYPSGGLGLVVVILLVLVLLGRV
jgi:asparagine N-glycosylation enzyme membrane subunit Stt3